jgi:hypothetical protein
MIVWILTAVIATSEVCAVEPATGSREESEYCRFQKSGAIETPYFSVTVEGGFNVGVDHGGRRLVAQPVLRQSPASFEIEVYDALDPTRVSGCTKEIEFEQNGLTWHECVRESPGVFWRLLRTRVGRGEAVVQYHYSPAGAKFGPALERMLQSTRIKISSP